MDDEHRVSGLREHLLNKEAWDSPLRDKYEAETQTLLLQKVTPLRWWSLVIISVVLVAVSVLCGWLVATITELPPLARACLIEGVVFQVVAVVYCVRVLRSGVHHRRRHPVFLSGLMWCFAVVLAVNLLMLIPAVPDVKIAILFLGIALVTLIGTGLQLLRTCIEQSELNLHERLLETVLRLTDTYDKTS